MRRLECGETEWGHCPRFGMYPGRSWKTMDMRGCARPLFPPLRRSQLQLWNLLHACHFYLLDMTTPWQHPIVVRSTMIALVTQVASRSCMDLLSEVVQRLYSLFQSVGSLEPCCLQKKEITITVTSIHHYIYQQTKRNRELCQFPSVRNIYFLHLASTSHPLHNCEKERTRRSRTLLSLIFMTYITSFLARQPVPKLVRKLSCPSKRLIVTLFALGDYMYPRPSITDGQRRTKEGNAGKFESSCMSSDPTWDESQGYMASQCAGLAQKSAWRPWDRANNVVQWPELQL